MVTSQKNRVFPRPKRAFSKMDILRNVQNRFVKIRFEKKHGILEFIMLHKLIYLLINEMIYIVYPHRQALAVLLYIHIRV
jgi:hypothetical protein